MKRWSFDPNPLKIHSGDLSLSTSYAALSKRPEIIANKIDIIG